MHILAIESSCDETAAAVVRDGRTALSNVVASQVDEHRKFGGVVPEIASRRHVENIDRVVAQALADAELGLDGIDAVAVTAAPGLIGALLVGVNFAKGLALAADKPLIPVHHLRSHVAANYLAHPDLQPPFLALIVSGGHSHLAEVNGYTEYRVLGRTRDDAAGEAFDKVARVLGLPYPGGVYLDRLAQQGDPTAFRLPTPHLSAEGGGDLDFSFSGLKTAVVNTVHNLRQKGTVDERTTRDLAASFQQTVCTILCRNTMEAAARTGLHTVVLAGGVSANSGLRSRMAACCAEAGLRLYSPPLPLCGDNAAMVGAQGFYEYSRLAETGRFAGADLNAAATMPIDGSFEQLPMQWR